MAMIAAIGRDMGLLRRWAEALHETGHICTLMMPGELGSHAPSICLFDLGPRGDADTSPLIDAIAGAPTPHFVAMSARPNAPEGIELLRKHKDFAVILSDFRMPGMDGMEVLRRVKRDHPDVEVIIVTGHGSDADEAAARRAA